MGQEAVTLEYASGVGERMGVPWKWGLVGVAVVNVGVFYVPFISFSRDRSMMWAFASLCGALWQSRLGSGNLGEELFLISVSFALAPVTLYAAARQCWGGRLRIVEYLLGWGAAAAGAIAILVFAVEAAQYTYLYVWPWPWFFWACCGVSWAIVGAGVWLALRLAESHRAGADVLALLMAIYIANACLVTWVVQSPLYDVRVGAMLCAGVSVWFLVELVVMWVRDRAWRRANRE